MVAVLTKVFGTHNLQLAEDMVQDTFIKAIDNWTVNSIPENPSAWLFAAARNKAIDVIRRQKREQLYADHLSTLLQSEYSLSPTLHNLINTHTIDDDKLRMIFVCCHPSLSPEATATLVLRTVCGLGITEIARAFLTNYDTVEKRLYRSKQTFKQQNISFELPAGKELSHRLHRVLLCVYLLFNEGYNSTQHDCLIRTDLMCEAMQLCAFILQSPSVPHEEAHALMALMCFTTARNKARQDNEENILLIRHQDRSKWNDELIRTGIAHLEQSATGDSVSRYHLEAGIAYEHANAKEYAHTNWQQIIRYYDILVQLQRSPLIALNRAIAISELHGAAAGIEAISNIEGIAFLKHYYLLPATLGELHLQLHQYEKAHAFFEQAIELTKSDIEKKFLQKKITEIKKHVVTSANA